MIVNKIYMDNISATDKLLFCNFGMYLRDNECVSRLEKKKKKKKNVNIASFLEAIKVIFFKLYVIKHYNLH